MAKKVAASVSIYAPTTTPAIMNWPTGARLTWPTPRSFSATNSVENALEDAGRCQLRAGHHPGQKKHVEFLEEQSPSCLAAIPR
jgi:hypothetical protein